MSLSSVVRITLADPIPSEPPRFLVGGQVGSASGDVKMYEWHRSKGQMQLADLQTDLGQIRALAWSPSPAHRHVLAVGSSTGRTILTSLSSQTLSTPVSSSQQSSSSSSTIATLPIKNPRPVTALSFSTVDPSYLAAGYERHRSDPSFMIWDLSSTMSHLPPDGDTPWQRPAGRLESNIQGAKDTRAEISDPRPVQQYCFSEHVNDVTFVPSTSTVLASTNNKAVRLFDLRVPGPNSTSRDTSTSSGAAPMQWLTRAVSSLSPDPSDTHRFASYESSSSGSTVRLWDTRKPGSEILSLEVNGAILGTGWLPGGSGMTRLGVGTKDGVGVWDIISGQTTDHDGIHDWTSLGEMRQVLKPKQPMQSFTFTTSTEKAQSDVLFVLRDGSIGVGAISSAPSLASSSRGDVAVMHKSLTAIDTDLVPALDTPMNDEKPVDDATDDEDEGTVIRSNRFQLRQPRINSILANERSRSRASSTSGSSLLRGVQGIHDRRRGTPGEKSRRDEFVVDQLSWSTWQRVISADVGPVMRRRAEEGYGLSQLLLNAAVGSNHPGHERITGIWEFVDHLTKIMDPATSRNKSVDLTYASAYSIWTGNELSPPAGESPRSPASVRSQSTLVSETTGTRTSSHTSTPREPMKQGSAAWNSLRNTQHALPSRTHHTPIPSPSPQRMTPEPPKNRPLPDDDLSIAVENIMTERGQRGHAGKLGPQPLPSTSRAAQRRMILSICGDMGALEVNRLVAEEERTKAACWSYFSGEEEQAVRILMGSRNSKHRLLGTTIAGFLSQSRSTWGSSSSFFDDHWRSLVNRVDDPYVRAILSRIGGDGWESVLEEEAMPLLDRVAIAVVNLSDDELGDFLQNRYARFSRNASPTFNLLSLLGFISASVDGLRRWVERTGDIQTVALLSVYFPSFRISPSEREIIRRWTEAYRTMLDCWGLWAERVDFDLRRAEIGRALGEQRVVEENLGADMGICPVCNNPLSKTHEEHLSVPIGTSRDRAAPRERQANCTFCGQLLPRCVICLRQVESHSKLGPSRDDWDDPLDSQMHDSIDQAYMCCLTCRHGGHANHILPWFEGGLDGEPGQDVCPVSGCQCRCAEI